MVPSVGNVVSHTDVVSHNMYSVSATPSSSIQKRQREEEEGSAEITEHTGEESDVPASKKQRGVQRVEPVVSQ